MKKNVITLLAVVLLIAGISMRLHRSGKWKPANANSTAPDFSLQDLSGQTQTLSSYQGKVVMLNFWATWCTPCQKEIPEFIALQNKYQNQGFRIIGISMDDSIDPVRPFYQQMKINYPVVLGSAKLGEQYGGILGLPVSFLIGSDGRIRAKHIGPVDMVVLEQEIQKALHPAAG